MQTSEDALIHTQQIQKCFTTSKQTIALSFFICFLGIGAIIRIERIESPQNCKSKSRLIDSCDKRSWKCQGF